MNKATLKLKHLFLAHPTLYKTTRCHGLRFHLPCHDMQTLRDKTEIGKEGVNLLNDEIKDQESKLDAMKQWCTDDEITATPTIFINGKLLPETYNINELKNIF